MKKTYLSILMALSSATALAETRPPANGDYQVTQQSVSDFVYPERTHTDADIIYHDVLVLISPQAIEETHNGDIEGAIAYVESAIALNNEVFEKQDIPLRRKIAGIVPIGDPSWSDKFDGIESNDLMQSLERVYKNSQFLNAFNPSYVTAYISYQEETEALGRARLGGYLSWFMKSPSLRTLSHELAHNDGFVHDREVHDEYSGSRQAPLLLATDYSVGYACGQLSSIMEPTAPRREAFFSSPLTINATEPCGIDNESDSVRSYKEAVATLLPNRTGTFRNNVPSRELTGSVGLSVVNPTVTEGESVTLQIVWSGADLGDFVQIITRKGTADDSDFNSNLITMPYNGEPVREITLSTVDDDIFEVDETYSYEVINGHGVNLDETQKIQEVTIISDEAGNAGTFNFTQQSINIVEGESQTIRVEREGGTDGSFGISLTSEEGSATNDDFFKIERTTTFDEGQEFYEFTVGTRADTTSESTESFTVTIGGDTQLVGSNSVLTVNITSSAPTPSQSASSDSGGGSFGLFGLFGLGLVGLRKILE